MRPPLSDILLGCALGDSWGRAVERKSLEVIQKEYGWEGVPLPEGDLLITDDTQMSLYLAEALAADAAVWDIPRRVCQAWVDWLDDPENFRAPGLTCLDAARKLKDGVPWQDATDTSSDGSGAVMRAWACAYLPEHLQNGVAMWQAASTHGAPNAIMASVIATRLAADGFTDGEVTATISELCRDVGWLTKDDKAWLVGLDGMGDTYTVGAFIERGRTGILSKVAAAWKLVNDGRSDPWSFDPSDTFPGWRSHDALMCAAVCLDMFPGDPASAVRRAVTTEGDSDTIGAVAGALAARRHPFPWKGIDANWYTRLEPGYLEWIGRFN